MRELAVQAANGTADGGGDRAALKSEFDALETEINRIAAKTTFAGIQLVDGSFTAADSGRFQVGARGSETITHTSCRKNYTGVTFLFTYISCTMYNYYHVDCYYYHFLMTFYYHILIFEMGLIKRYVLH